MSHKNSKQCIRNVFEDGYLVTNCVDCNLTHIPILNHEIYPTFWNSLTNCIGFYKVIDVITVPSHPLFNPSLVVIVYGLINCINQHANVEADFEKVILNIFQNQNKLLLVTHFFGCIRNNVFHPVQDTEDLRQMISDTIEETNSTYCLP